MAVAGGARAAAQPNWWRRRRRRRRRPCRLLGAAAVDDDAGDRVSGGVGLEPRDRALVRSVTFGCAAPVGRSDMASALPWRHGKPSKSRSGRSGPARAPPRREDPVGRGNGLQPCPLQVVVKLRMRGSCADRRVRKRRDRAGSVGSSPALAMDEVELLGLRRSRARGRRRRSARRERSRRRASPRRSPARGGGRGSRRRPWCCRRRSSGRAGGTALPCLSYQCSGVT